MATSDNVIRAGLTPKHRDVPNLVAGLTYEAADAAKHLVRPLNFLGTRHSTMYNPPIPEFAVVRVDLKPCETEDHPPIDGPSVAIVTEGSGKISWGDADALEVRRGEVFFVGAGTKVRYEAVSEEKDTWHIYRAFVDVRG